MVCVNDIGRKRYLRTGRMYFSFLCRAQEEESLKAALEMSKAECDTNGVEEEEAANQPDTQGSGGGDLLLDFSSTGQRSLYPSLSSDSPLKVVRYSMLIQVNIFSTVVKSVHFICPFVLCQTHTKTSIIFLSCCKNYLTPEIRTPL